MNVPASVKKIFCTRKPAKTPGKVDPGMNVRKMNIITGTQRGLTFISRGIGGVYLDDGGGVYRPVPPLGVTRPPRTLVLRAMDGG